jgi:peroxiredoxin Q/BCP
MALKNKVSDKLPVSARAAKAKPPMTGKLAKVARGGKAKIKPVEMTAAKVSKATKAAGAPRIPALAAPATSAGIGLLGKKAPGFSLADQDGNSVTLASLTARGNVVLYFYPKDMTPGCTTQACDFRDNLNAVRAFGAQVVGVSSDSSASHQKFIAKQSLNFTLLSDPDNTVTKAYGVYKMKSLYGRQFMGIERTTFVIGRDGVIKRAFPKVKVNGHSDEVLAALKGLE